MAWKNASKFRNVRPSAYPFDLSYPDIDVSTSAGDGGLIAASNNFIAVLWRTSTGGTVGILPHSQYGKRKQSVPLIHGHSSQINDLQWNPFHDWILVTAGTDSLVKLWRLPEEGLTADVSTPEATLEGHAKKVEAISWHPTAYGLLATASADKSVRVFDVNTNQQKIKIDSFGETVWDVDWNRNGSSLAATSGDQQLRIIDPRSNKVVSQAQSHLSPKCSKVIWLGSTHNIVTTGANKTRDREWSIWDSRNIVKPLTTSKLGTGTGVLDPYYDNDTQILVLTGRGDSSIKLFEISSASPYFSDLPTYASSIPHRGITIVPKLTVNVMAGEVIRILQVTSNSIQPISITVPRKSYSDFHADIFPNTAGQEPALTQEEWFSGSDKDPILVSLDPSKTKDGIPQVVAKEPPKNMEKKPVSTTPSTPPPRVKTVEVPRNESPSQTPLSTSNDADEEGEWYVPKSLNIVRTSSYRHIFGKPFNRTECYENLKVLSNPLLYHSIRANKKFFAVPVAGPGGRLAIIPLKSKGRLPTNFPVIESGAGIHDFDFNPFDDGVIAIGSENSSIKIFKIPDDGLFGLSNNLTNHDALLKGHQHKIVSIDFHPTASNILISTSGDNTVKLWDINKEDAQRTISFKDTPLSITWNYTASTLSVLTKDYKISIVDPRQEKIIQDVDGSPKFKPSKLEWLGKTDQIFAIGSGQGSARVASLYDSRNLSKTITTLNIDNGSSQMSPYFDMDTGVMALWGKGEGNIKFYEINDNAPFIHHLTDFNTSAPQTGLAFLPKLCVNVRDVEIIRVLKLTKETVEPIQFIVPRQRKEFFQDDVYPLTRAQEPVVTSTEWLSGANKEPKLVSLCPTDMKPLSEAPKLVRKIKKYVAEDDTLLDPDKLKNRVLDKFHQKMQEFKEDEHDKPPGHDMDGCNSDEWSD
eukprot:TRINITY_DN581_c0_g1_i1.p1 TRINITY_DN581_c0_g1~~TRINITY_DN581_c0_g1_i1.p1  ORF type:complete len:921 (-),score=175.71 TRINITY_DN581_c0_g1_i1:31-2793(-)